MKAVAIDTETTGVDFNHGARPFLVSMCEDNGRLRFWEWPVDPTNRRPDIPIADLREIWETILEYVADGWEIVGHNIKFDVRALGTVLDRVNVDAVREWPWAATHDTLIAGHLLSSNTPHDLTSMALQYLRIDIEFLEKSLHDAVETCRRTARRDFPHWAIAKEGRPDMPSAKEKSWKYDQWLPATYARHMGIKDSPFFGLCSDYANADTSATVMLWQVCRGQIKARDLWAIYTERKRLSRIAATIEENGVTLSEARLKQLRDDYRGESENRRRACVDIASARDYELTLPKSGNNNSLLDFCFSPEDFDRECGQTSLFCQPRYLRLPIIERTDTGNPSLNKQAIETYQRTLDGDALEFIRNLSAKRSLDTAVGYLDSYARFLRPILGDGVREGYAHLHPSLNITGTDTLRWSSNNPNAQNISKKENFNLRYCFGPIPGREWWSLDAKNIELRIPAYESGEAALIALYEDPDAPPFYGSNHMLIFSILHPEKWEAAIREHGPERAAAVCKKTPEYQRTKNGNFAVQYGAVMKADGEGTADKAYGVPGGQRMVKERFQKQEALNRKWINFANRHGYVETMPDRDVHPHRGYPLLCTRTESGGILETVPLNYHVQGTAMWWTARAMVRCQELLDEWNKRVKIPNHYRIAIQVHDELVFDFPARAHPSESLAKSNYARVMELAALMAKGGDAIGVPTPVGIEYHTPETGWSTGTILK